MFVRSPVNFLGHTSQGDCDNDEKPDQDFVVEQALREG